MAYRDLVRGIRYPDKTSARYKRLDGLDRLRQGTLYDHIKTSFDEEYDGSGEYIPMRQRRPSIIWGGARMLVDQLSGLLWGDEQMPIVRTYYGEQPSTQDRAAEQAIQQLVKSVHLDAIMDEVTDAASSGSCAVILRSTSDKRLYYEVVPGKECTPVFDPRNPMELVGLEQLCPTTGRDLVEIGYEIADDDLDTGFWFRLTIDDIQETRYIPMTDERYAMLGQKDPKTGETVKWEIDADNSWPHEWPILPVLWVKSPSRGTRRIDGDCLYGGIVDMLVSIDYDLSQLERGFRFTADPMLAIRRGELQAGSRPLNPTGAENKDQTQKVNGKIVKSPTNVLDIAQGGDAKYLEISGKGLDAMREFVKTLREWGLEIAGGMKSDASTTKGVESGRALEILYQNLILVLKRWRVALGDMAYLSVIRMLLAALANGVIEVDGVEPIGPDVTMHLSWPEWMTPSGQELSATANAWQILAGGSTMDPVPVLPRALVTRIAASNLGITDVSNVLEELSKQQLADEQKAQEQADQDHARSLEMTQPKSTPTGGK